MKRRYIRSGIPVALIYLLKTEYSCFGSRSITDQVEKRYNQESENLHQ
jgi:hypothetical protein